MLESFAHNLDSLNSVDCKKRPLSPDPSLQVGEKGSKSALGRGVMPALRLAVEHVNKHPTILRNYKLHVTWNDTEVRGERFPRCSVEDGRCACQIPLQWMGRSIGPRSVLIWVGVASL